MSNKEILQAEVDELMRQIVVLNEQANAKNQEIDAIYLAEHGVVLGETVVQCKGKEYLATTLHMRCYGQPWLKGKLRLRDGKFSDSERHIYGEWEIVKGAAHV